MTLRPGAPSTAGNPSRLCAIASSSGAVRAVTAGRGRPRRDCGDTVDRWGRERARAYLDALEARLTQLAHQPLIGRRREELAPGLLAFPFESHVVFYRASDFGIAVVRVLHKRQDPFGHVD